LSGRPSNKSAFANCGLTSFTLPVSVNDFGDYIFIDCYQLTNVIISPGVLTLRETMFSFCNALQSLAIPDSVTYIDTWDFAGCANLTHIDVSPGNPAYSSINGVVFKKNQTALLSFPSGFSGNYAIPVGVTNIGDSAFLDCVGVTNITIPNGVTRIGIESFADCYDLANISIPSSVTYIGDSAFYPDYELTSVYFQGNAPQIGTSIFGASDSGIDNSTVYYLPGATGWGTAFGGLPTALWLPQISVAADLSAPANQFGFNISWAATQTVVVQACTNLINPVWAPVATITLTSGSAYFSDPTSTNCPGRFSRLRSQ
jgi:hypothetical protein